MVKFVKNKSQSSGPSSALGITRFFDAESKSPKISPYFVIGVAVIIIIIMLILRFIIPA
ncbi:MAG: preprotein translocase subunit Sec61beta [Candidatus ainarchaeum sp.]|nr:preprotein translocase subunit Sec61beta [Candidatus ainarchaeum sp.]